MKELKEIILALVNDNKFLDLYFKKNKDGVLMNRFILEIYIQKNYLWRDEKVRNALLKFYETTDVDYVCARLLLCVDYFIEEYPKVTGTKFP